MLDFTLQSGPGQHRGFFRRYFVNEHLLRFLVTRYPLDYDRVALPTFWAGHLVWLLPWSGLLAGIRRLPLGTGDRAGRTRRLMLCFCGFTLLFFSASTTQEYYTLPACAPAMLLLASTVIASSRWLTITCRLAGTVYGVAFLTALMVLIAVWELPAQGDIATALTSNPDAYTLALGHFQDLTLEAFAYLRGPLLLTAAAFGIGAAGSWMLSGRRAAASLACAAVLSVHASHWAMAAFDPYLSSRPLAEAYMDSPPGELVLDHEYYAFSSLAHYANRPVWLLNGRTNNIEYGSHAPGAPNVFLDDGALVERWHRDEPVDLATYRQNRSRSEALLGSRHLKVVAASGGKILFANKNSAPSHTRP